MKVEELQLTHIKSADEAFKHAVGQVQIMIKDIDEGRLPDGSKLKLTLDITFEPTPKLDGVEIACQGAIKLPKYMADSVHALNRNGKLKVVDVDQGELPGIKGARVVPINGDN